LDESGVEIGGMLAVQVMCETAEIVYSVK